MSSFEDLEIVTDTDSVPEEAEREIRVLPFVTVFTNDVAFMCLFFICCWYQVRICSGLSMESNQIDEDVTVLFWRFG